VLLGVSVEVAVDDGVIVGVFVGVNVGVGKNAMYWYLDVSGVNMIQPTVPKETKSNSQ
jgi:hypothetical protein